jgi:hypothetical protein
MTFEIGTLESTRWTSNSPRPFARAPGAGLGDGIVRRPRRAATTSYESGFAADPVGGEQEPIRVLGSWPVTVTKKAVLQGEIPAALVQLYFTDRGTVSQTALDEGIYKRVREGGFKVSRASKFEPVAVKWAWKHDTQADFYYPVVSSPAKLAGMKYAGNAIQLPAYNAAPSDLAKLPSKLYVYTFAVTTKENVFSDGDGAKLLSLLRMTLGNTLPVTKAYANVHVTLLGSKPSVFNGGVTPSPGPAPGPTPGPSPTPITPVPAPVAVTLSSLVLIAAINLLTPHIGAHP